MEPEEIHAALLKLNHTQMVVMFWRLRKIHDSEIEDIADISDSSVWAAAGKIYKAFHIAPGRGDLRWIELLRTIPDLKKYVDDIVPDESALAVYKNPPKKEKKPGRKPKPKREVKSKVSPQSTEEGQPPLVQVPETEPPPPQIEESQPAPAQAEENQPPLPQIPEIEQPPPAVTPPPAGTEEPPITQIPFPIPRDPGRAIIDLLRRHPMLFLLIVFSIVCLVLVQFIFSHLQPPVQTANHPLPNPTTVPLLLTSTLPQTSTITPTIEPYRSPTSIPTNTPNPNILFFDDFDNGISPAWQVLLGDPITIDGHLPAPAKNILLMVVGDKSWQRIQIEFDYLQSGYAEYTDICVRFVDIKNGIYFTVSADDMGWYMLKDGNKTTIGDSVTVPNQRGPWPWVLVVDGFNYSANLDFDVVSSINTKEFNSGQVGVQMYSGERTVIDNFKVSRLP